jgi:predicted nucleic acid-binding protein
MKLFINTNVVINVIASREPFVFDSLAIFNLCESGKADGQISALTFCTVSYVLRKFVPPDIMRIKLREFRNVLIPIDLTLSVLDKALSSSISDFEDAVQYFSSQSFVADCIITRNPKDFEKSSVPVYTPIEFLQMPYWMDTPNDQMLNEPDVRYGEQ